MGQKKSLTLLLAEPAQESRSEAPAASISAIPRSIIPISIIPISIIPLSRTPARAHCLLRRNQNRLQERGLSAPPAQKVIKLPVIKMTQQLG